MSTRKSTFFYGVLIGFVCLVVGMVVASRLDLAPGSFANVLDVPATNSAPLTGPIDATTFRNIAREASPAVVSITTMRPARPVRDIGDLFGFPLPFGGPGEQPPADRQERGAGSGFVIDKAGYILTNNHVIDGATSISVWLPTMREREPGLSAKVIGRDELTDTALLQLTEEPDTALAVSKFGDSDQMAPGDWVMAIGNPFGLSNTVTVGVVSAVGRETPAAVRTRTEEMIQTDAAINQGNSGGPLLNIRGEVIGINTMIISPSQSFDGSGGGNVGVGFAVPINTVRDLLPQLRQGKVVRGRIGVSLDPRPMSRDYAASLGLPNANGAEVRDVEAGGPAAGAGMRTGDVIVEFNGRPIANNSELVGMVTRTAPGTTVPVKVIRDRKTVSLNVTVQELNLEQERSQFARNQPRPNREEPTSTDFGMALQDLTPALRRQLELPTGRTGVVVASVTPFGPAAEAGLQPGDVILQIQGQALSRVDETTKALGAIAAGQTVRLIVWQEGREVLVRLRRR
jgi:serine protease Do